MIIAEATEDIRLILDRFVYSAHRVLPMYGNGDDLQATLKVEGRLKLSNVLGLSSEQCQNDLADRAEI